MNPEEMDAKDVPDVTDEELDSVVGGGDFGTGGGGGC
jgi:hypothetical protein